MVRDDHVDCSGGEGLPKLLRFSRSRIGGQHLNSVAPSGISSAANRDSAGKSLL
jgi:hypothetical protein